MQAGQAPSNYLNTDPSTGGGAVPTQRRVLPTIIKDFDWRGTAGWGGREGGGLSVVVDDCFDGVGTFEHPLYCACQQSESPWQSDQGCLPIL